MGERQRVIFPHGWRLHKKEYLHKITETDTNKQMTRLKSYLSGSDKGTTARFGGSSHPKLEIKYTL